MMDRSARALSAEATRRDDFVTAEMERKRLRILAAMSADSRQYARANPSARQLTHGGTVYYRRLKLAITVSEEEARLRATVEVCKTFEGERECGSERNGLRPSETSVAKQIADTMVGEETEEERPPDLPPLRKRQTTQM